MCDNYFRYYYHTRYTMIEKNITFIYMDSAEKEIMKPLAEEAKKRGYQVKLTTNKFEKCEIGVYCQHVNFPQYSKFSIIMLHDIIQQYGNWPDIWFREPWDKYDIGILPSDQWVTNWNKCSQWSYANPRVGMYKVGWPKADIVANINREQYRIAFYKKYNLDIRKKTVLYAPSWENDNKQDDFVKAVRTMDVNILIKQYPATMEVQPQQYKNIKAMYELYKNDRRVTILDPKMNIFNAILAADLLVSEESSTMAEALMMGIPSISVSDWLIPDVTPSRFPECNYEFVIMTKKAELAKCIDNIIKNYGTYKQNAEEWKNKLFCNIGKSSCIIMDIIDDCVQAKKIRYEALKPNPKEKIPFVKKLKHVYICMCREITLNYSERSKLIAVTWRILRMAKKWISGFNNK